MSCMKGGKTIVSNDEVNNTDNRCARNGGRNMTTVQKTWRIWYIFTAKYKITQQPSINVQTVA